MDAKTRILELHATGISHAGVAAQLNKDRFVNAKGGAWTNNAVRSVVNRAKEKNGVPSETVIDSAKYSETPEACDTSDSSYPLQDSRTGDSSKIADADDVCNVSDLSDIERPPDIPKPSDTADRCDLSDLSDDLPEQWKNQIIQVVRQEVSAMLESGNLPISRTELPDRGKRREGGKTKISASISTTLFNRIEDERKQTNASFSAVIDAALWHYFNKPALNE